MRRLVLPVVFIASVIVIAMVAVVIRNQNTGSETKKKSEVISEYATDETAAGLVFTDETGKEIALTSISQPYLLTFWSSSCTECKQSLTDLQSFVAKNSKFKVVLVSFRDTPEKAKAKLTEYGVTFSTYYDSQGGLFSDLSASIPSSYMIEGGKITYYFPGRIDSDFLTQLLTEF